MASSIEWTNHSWNVTSGCTKIGSECDLCYAAVATHMKKDNPKTDKYRKGFDVVVEHEYTLDEPKSWKKPRTVFVNSMSDLFHKDVSLEYIKKVFQVMNDTPEHTYQVLTKRHTNLEKYSDELNWTDNIWAGVSVGNQSATKRIKSLVNCGAKHKFLSIEPFIGEITDIDIKGIDWVIVGGESGSNEARPLEKDWILKIQEACSREDVPFFFKQWGKTRNNPNPNDPSINKLHRYHSKGGSQLDGRTYWGNPTIEDDSCPTIDLFGKEYLVMDEHYDFVTIWELKSHLPFQDEEVYKKLKKDIRENGLNDPILIINTTEGRSLVVEGHTRLRAMIELKRMVISTKLIKEDFKSLDEVKLWMVKHQLQRRNLTTVEKVNLAFRSKPTIEKLAKENLSLAGKSYTKNGDGNSIEIQKIDTNEEIAKIAGVSKTTVFRYSQILTYASQSTLNKLNKGDISIGSAHTSIEHKIGKEPPVKKQPNQPISNEFIALENIQEGGMKLIADEIDMVVMVNNFEDLKVLKKNTSVKIGVVGLNGDSQ